MLDSQITDHINLHAADRKFHEALRMKLRRRQLRMPDSKRAEQPRNLFARMFVDHQIKIVKVANQTIEVQQQRSADGPQDLILVQ